MKKSYFSITILTVLVQYYEYYLYGFLAAKIAIEFFPDQTITKQLLATYFLMWFSYIAKPFGAYFLGKIGDTKGRIKSLSTSLIISTVSSFIIFLIPGYNEIGFTAIIILLCCRLFICAMTSAGSDGARIYIYEKVNPKWRCMSIAFTILFTQAGVFLAASSAFVFTSDLMPPNAWRYSFLLGSMMGGVLFYLIKKSSIEKNEMIQNKSNDDLNKSTWQIINENKKLFLLTTFSIGIIGSSNQFVIVFLTTYVAKILGIKSFSTLQFNLLTNIPIYMIFALIFGFISDISNKKLIITIGAVSTILLMLIQAKFLEYKQFSTLVFTCNCACLPMLHIPAAFILKSSIPQQYRYRLFSLAHAMGSLAISAPTSFIATSIFDRTSHPQSPLYFFIILIVILYLCLLQLSSLKSKFKQQKNEKTEFVYGN